MLSRMRMRIRTRTQMDARQGQVQGDCPALSSYGREACLSAVDNRQWFQGELCVWCINDCENKHLCEVRSHARPLDNYEGCFSDDQDPRKCAKEDEKCCHGQVVYGQLVNGYNGSMYPLDYDAMIEKDKEGFEFRSKICKEMGIPDCCEGYWCDTMCYGCCRKRDD